MWSETSGAVEQRVVVEGKVVRAADSSNVACGRAARREPREQTGRGRAAGARAEGEGAARQRTGREKDRKQGRVRVRVRVVGKSAGRRLEPHWRYRARRRAGVQGDRTG